MRVLDSFAYSATVALSATTALAATVKSIKREVTAVTVKGNGEALLDHVDRLPAC